MAREPDEASPLPPEEKQTVQPAGDTDAAASQPSPAAAGKSPEHASDDKSGEGTALPSDGVGSAEPSDSSGQSATATPAEPDHSHHDDFHDPAHDEYSEYHDPYHNNPYHEEQTARQTVGEESYEPHGEYYREPGDEGFRKQDEPGAGKEEETFEGLFGADDEEGGPVKTFLEHLEDLRWVIIKSLAAVAIAMVTCLVAAPTLVSVLTWPLKNPLIKPADPRQFVQLELGTNHWKFAVTTNEAARFGLGTNPLTAFKLAPVAVGTNVVLGLEPVPQPAADTSPFGPILKIYDPKEAITVALKLALYGGLGLSSPFVFFFIGQFLVPALKKKERYYLYRGLAVGTGLFLGGVAFAYVVLLRVAFYFVIEFANWMGFAADEWRAAETLGFTILMIVGMGLAFELPVVLLTLVKIGILDYERLTKLRPYWFILNLVASAFITPSGDPFTMLLMALPIQVLYEISVWIAWYWERRDRKREAEAAKA